MAFYSTWFALDASVILTEDTDSFIIGDKVWVGGTKPGQIAYIGETQFAPGEWAGVVLDETIGKISFMIFLCNAKSLIHSKNPLVIWPVIAKNFSTSFRQTKSESIDCLWLLLDS